MNEVRYVEVKGTQEDGSEILLMPNELNHKHAGQVALFVVYGVVLSDGDGEEPQASGGTAREIWPWNVDDGVLTPLTYRLALPPLEG